MNSTLQDGIALAALPMARRLLLAVAATKANTGLVINALGRVPTKGAADALDRLVDEIERGGCS